MGFLDYMFGLSTSADVSFPHDPSDDRAWPRTSSSRDYWGGHSGPSSTGLYVRPEDALGVSCIFLGTRIYSELLGTLPLLFYRESGTKDPRTPLPRHPIARLLAPSHGTQPNPWQTGAQFRIVTIAHCVLWGLGLSEITWDTEMGGGMQLIPIDPDWISDIDEMKDRRTRYKVNEPGRTPRILTQDQVFRFEGFGTHSRIPESLLKRSREAVSVWLAQQQFMGSYYRRGAQPSIVVRHPGPGALEDDVFERTQATLQSSLGGLRNAHKVALLEDGMEVKEIGHTARNAQTVELIKSQAIEIGTRYMGLPAHLFGGENPPYASREYVMQELVQIPLRPKGVLFEGAVHRDLVAEEDVVCEHDYDGLLQGSFLEQVQALSVAVMSALLSENEARERLGYGPVDGLDEPRRSANMDRGGDPRGPRQEPKEITSGLMDLLMNTRLGAGTGAGTGAVSSPDPATPPERTYSLNPRRTRSILETAARQLLDREVRNLHEKSKKFSAQPAEWKLWLTDFYRVHAEKVAESMAVDEATARRYTDGHRERVVREGVGVMEEWVKDGMERGVREMVKMAMEQGE